MSDIFCFGNFLSISLIEINIFHTGVEGALVASSPVIEINKQLMGLSGWLERGVMFPKHVRLNIPVPLPDGKESGFVKRNIRVMQKVNGGLQKGILKIKNNF